MVRNHTEADERVPLGATMLATGYYLDSGTKAGPGREAFPERRDTKADFDHGT